MALDQKLLVNIRDTYEAKSKSADLILALMKALESCWLENEDLNVKVETLSRKVYDLENVKNNDAISDGVS